jgi:hypothetical protein
MFEGNHGIPTALRARHSPAIFLGNLSGGRASNKVQYRESDHAGHLRAQFVGRSDDELIAAASKL